MHPPIDFRQAAQKAIDILAAQPVVPDSPGEADAAQCRYCTAAAIVKAGERLLGRDTGLDDAVRDGSSEGVIQRFVAMGWDEALGRRIMELNDREDPANRKGRMILYLSELCSAREETAPGEK